MEPLAAKIRPKSLEHFVGQEHLVGSGKPLKIAIEKKHIFSFILWGPPGVGKTTLARIYANALEADYYELSAVSTGKEDIRKIIEKKSTAASNRPKVLFLDEIHRFNKAQQDFLLPYVESGMLTLIGATTENPSFEVISPLLSRCRVFVLHELRQLDIETIITHAGHTIDSDAQEWITRMANGDARQAIAMVDNTFKLYQEITVETLQKRLKSITTQFRHLLNQCALANLMLHCIIWLAWFKRARIPSLLHVVW